MDQVLLYIIIFFFISWRSYSWILENDHHDLDVFQVAFSIIFIALLSFFLKLTKHPVLSLLLLLPLYGFPIVPVFHNSITLMFVGVIILYFKNFQYYVKLIIKEKILKILLLNLMLGVVFFCFSLYRYQDFSLPTLGYFIKGMKIDFLYLALASLVVKKIHVKNEKYYNCNIISLFKSSLICLSLYTVISLLYLFIFSDYYNRYTGLGLWNFYRFLGSFNGAHALSIFICSLSVWTIHYYKKKWFFYLPIKCFEVILIFLSGSRTGLACYVIIFLSFLYIYRSHWKSSVFLVVFTFFVYTPLFKSLNKSFLYPRNSSSIYYSESKTGVMNFEAMRHFSAGSNSHRKEILKESFEILKGNSFILGVGSGMEESVNSTGQDAHMSMINIFVEKGIVGLALYLLLIYTVFKKVVKAFSEKNKIRLVLYFSTFFVPLFFGLAYSSHRLDISTFLICAGFYGDSLINDGCLESTL